MKALGSYDQWMQTGRLAQYVTSRKSAGSGIVLFENAQPPGDMSDPACSSLVLIQVRSERVAQRSDFGGGKRESTAGRGAFVLVPPYFATDIDVFVPHEIRAVSFEVDRFRSTMDEARPGRNPFDFGKLHDGPFHVPQLGGVLDRLWADAADQGSGRLFAESAAQLALAMIARKSESSAKPSKGGLAPWAERRVREFLATSFARDVSLTELAEIAGLSPFHFTRMFKQSIGISPYAYLRRVRVERAKQLLSTTAIPIVDVAIMVGYETPSAFTRMFRTETGSSPGHWRRVHGRHAGESLTAPADEGVD